MQPVSYHNSIGTLYVCVCRRFWYVPRPAELLHPPGHVHLLLHGRPGTQIPEIPLVEKIHDQDADCKFCVNTYDYFEGQ